MQLHGTGAVPVGSSQSAADGSCPRSAAGPRPLLEVDHLVQLAVVADADARAEWFIACHFPLIEPVIHSTLH